MRKSPESNNQEYPAFDVELSRFLGSVASGWKWGEVRMEIEAQIK